MDTSLGTRAQMSAHPALVAPFRGMMRRGPLVRPTSGSRALRGPRSTTTAFQNPLGTLLGLGCSLLAAEDGLQDVLWPSVASLGWFFGGPRSTTTAFQNPLGIFLGVVCSLLAAEGGLQNVLWPSVASLGGSVGALDRPRRPARVFLELDWASFARFLLPKMVFRTLCGRQWLPLWGLWEP